MTQIAWTESIPSGTSLVGRAPTDFRSVWTAVTTAMSTEHFYSGSGGASDASAGELLPGGSRCFVGARSASSVPSQGTGRLFLDRTNSRLFGYDSNGTYLLGTSWCEENSTDAGTGYWVRSSGAFTGVPTGSSSTVVAFALTYAAPPVVVMTSSSVSWLFSLQTSTTTNFTSFSSSLAAAAGTATINWEALGTLSSASY